jgi:hypothetical protein
VAPIPPEERGDLLGAYTKRLFGADQAEGLQAARTWSAIRRPAAHSQRSQNPNHP